MSSENLKSAALSTRISAGCERESPRQELRGSLTSSRYVSSKRRYVSSWVTPCSKTSWKCSPHAPKDLPNGKQIAKVHARSCKTCISRAKHNYSSTRIESWFFKRHSIDLRSNGLLMISMDWLVKEMTVSFHLACSHRKLKLPTSSLLAMYNWLISEIVLRC